ncbi:hypothetical protein [Streptomyces aidingensis]|uniref:Uncharacterized protein n=1 Tax=Streptomyces aidingensis TaxID=910347 RepID=A0A1I1MV25_9ACTN|nr:hypothetical protein [Streptomyces aidingensis]SFC89015.1 hypothetical protein SAMN05421773_10770 [Streptomyces aidingensis]
MRVSGLGDLIALVTGTLGAAPGDRCGCAHRRDLLNKMFPLPRRLRTLRRATGRG